MATEKSLEFISAAIRRDILVATTAAGSGHPSSSLSSVELMVGLFFGGVFRTNLNRPKYPNNDRLVFSKGHAAPLLYAMYAAAGKISEPALLTLRKFHSPLEGHPMPIWPYVDVPTGSLGQGLSVGLGMAIAATAQGLTYRTYVLLGDSEMSEGQVWEAIQLAGFRKQSNLTAILDVNRLGQSGQTMVGYDVHVYARRVQSFGWRTVVVDGHSLTAIHRAYQQALATKNKPTMIIAKTVKGKGVLSMENKNGWHGKVLTVEQLEQALLLLPRTKNKPVSVVAPTRLKQPKKNQSRPVPRPDYAKNVPVATRQAFANAVVRLAPKFPNLVVLDGEVKNSTFTEKFADRFPNRFFETYIAEQNMVSIATGMAARGLTPVAATFAAFLTRAFDQLRMAQYSGQHLIFAGTHAGVSIGQDGPSQMGLEDIAMFRTLGATVLYPADAWAAERLVEVALKTVGMVYLRLTRQAGPLLSTAKTSFYIGGSQTLRRSSRDRATVVTAGITVGEALQAADILADQRIPVRVIDAYSVQPLDTATLRRSARETKRLIVVEDHRPGGGLGEAVRSALGSLAGTVTSLAVTKTPRSGTPAELLRYEGIDAAAIVRTIKRLL